MQKSVPICNAGSYQALSAEGGKIHETPCRVAAFALMCGPAFAQNGGPAPQSGMDRPGMTTGAKQNGAMDATGMNTTKGNVKRETDGAPAPAKKDDARK
jgi:hypothetical protein